MISYYQIDRYYHNEILEDTLYEVFEVRFKDDSLEWFDNIRKTGDWRLLKDFVDNSVFHNCDKWEPTYQVSDEFGGWNLKSGTYHIIHPEKIIWAGILIYYRVQDD